MSELELPEGYVMPEEMAVNELKQFIDINVDEAIEADKLREQYPQVIKALCLGLLVLSENSNPTYDLKTPVKNADGEITLSKLSFRTRISASDQRKLAQGIDLSKDRLGLLHKCFAFVIQQPVAMLDKLGRFDYKVVEQLGQLFL